VGTVLAHRDGQAIAVQTTVPQLPIQQSTANTLLFRRPTS
jgi:hypothetical protein